MHLLISFVSLLLAATTPQENPASVPAAPHMTPKEALKKLLDGNERYSQDHLLHADSSADRREAIHSSQAPFAAILGCSDSRIPPEIIFDQGVGDLFIIRVAGNVVGDLEQNSIDYSVKYLKSSLVLVLGHENCGAVKAVLDGATKDINQIADLIKPAVKNCKELNVCIHKNIENTVKMIKKSPLIQEYMAKGEVDVVGAYYDLRSGKIELLP